MSLDVIRSIMHYTDWKYFRHSWSTRLNPTVTRNTKLLWGKLNCCKVFGSTKCLQQVFEGQRFTVSFSQHPKGVKIMVTPYLRQLSKCCTYSCSFSYSFSLTTLKYYLPGSTDEETETEMVRNLLKITGLVSDKAGTWNQAAWHHFSPVSFTAYVWQKALWNLKLHTWV